MKKYFVGFGVIAGVLAGVMLFNTFTFYSLQLDVEPISDNPVYRKRSIDKLSGAIQIPTISYQDTAAVNYPLFDSLITYLANQFPLVHSELDMQRVSQYSLLYRWRGKNTTTDPIVLAGHYDVVPAPDCTDWTYPPFSGRVADGYIWGRGALDDKIAVIGILEAVEMLLEEGYQPRKTVYLAFGHDEEIGGEQGAAEIAEILEAREETPDFVLDEGMMITRDIMPGIEEPVAIIGTGEKGYLSLELTATSMAGHSSMPPQKTAIGKLSRAIVNLENNPFPARMDAIAGEMFSYAGPEMNFPMRLIMANRWAFDPLLKWQLLQSPSTAALLRTTNRSHHSECRR